MVVFDNVNYQSETALGIPPLVFVLFRSDQAICYMARTVMRERSYRTFYLYCRDSSYGHGQRTNRNTAHGTWRITRPEIVA